MNQEELIKICIIDDIPTIVRGLSQRIPWKEYGIDVIAVASNGEEGLELIRELKPDIVLSDIRMPFMDGLEMMRLMSREKLDLKLIYLSGYTDFTYAQEAVKLGAFDFIVKPFTKEQVLEAVLRAKEAIERERSQRDQMRGMEQKLRESMPYLRQEYMRLAIRYGVKQDRHHQQWEFYGITMKSEDFGVMAVEIDFFADRTEELRVNEVELIRFAVQNIIEETISRYTQGIVFREKVNQFVIVVNSCAALSLEQLAEECRENVRLHTYQTISIGIGSEIKEATQLAMSYRQALTALAYTFLTGGNSVYCYEKEADCEVGPLRYSYEREKELLYCLRSLNLPKAEEQLELIWKEWLDCPARPAPDQVKSLCIELAHAIYRVFAEKLSGTEQKSMDQKLSEMAQSASFEELRRQIKDLCRQGYEFLNTRQVSDGRALVERAISHIRSHLHQNLSVGDCAKVVHLSPSYFSNIFKKEMGMTLAQYITSERMERAKELVVEGLQVQDIARSLGYEDRPYFTELFKRHTGMTPTDFRMKYTSSPR